MLLKMRWLIEGLVIFPAQMLANMNKVRGMIFSQPVLLALTEAGVSREDAYAWVQRCALRVWNEDLTLRDALDSDPQVTAHLDPVVLDRCFDLAHQLRHVPALFDRVLATTRG